MNSVSSRPRRVLVVLGSALPAAFAAAGIGVFVIGWSGALGSLLGVACAVAAGQACMAVGQCAAEGTAKFLLLLLLRLRLLLPLLLLLLHH